MKSLYESLLGDNFANEGTKVADEQQMKTLYSIVEKAIGNIGITFDEFKEYVDTAGGSPITKQKFFDKFGDDWYSKHKVFVHYVDQMIEDMMKMGVELDDNILMLIYKKLCNTPEAMINKLLGNGANAAVYDMGDKVIKIFFNGKIRTDNKLFYEYCLKSKFKFFPKVYRVGKGYAIMEKLKVETPKIRKWFDIIDKRVGDDSLYWQLKEDRLNWDSLTKEESEVMHWLEDCGKELWKNNILPEGDYGDLSIYNVGERSDGTLVYFDI